MQELKIEVGAYNTSDGVARKFLDLNKVYNVCIGGSIGSGKSVLLHEIISSINGYVILIDCKNGVEFSRWTKTNKVVNSKCYKSVDEAVEILQMLKIEMNSRYNRLVNDGKQNILQYDEAPFPHFTIIIDEVQDITEKSKTKKLLCDLVKKGRACGFHFIIATQTPSKKVLGDIKSQCGAYISLKVNTRSDSQLIINDSRAVDITQKGGLYVRVGDDLTYCVGLLTNFEKIGI